MKRTLICLLGLAAIALSATSASANLLTDPSFEAPVTFDGPPFVGSWEAFNGGGATAANSTAMPRTGAGHVDLAINSTPNTFAGLFQDVLVTPGNLVTFSGWNKSLSNPLELGAEVRIEWPGAGVGNTPNFVPTIGPDYTQFSVTHLVPATATTARVVYAIQSFSTNPLGNGLVSIDDFSVTAIPEPATVALAGLGLAGLLYARRRRS